MQFKLGPRTFSIPSARLPKVSIPQLRFMSWMRIPLPTTLRFGSARAGLTSLVVVGIGFAGTLFLVIAGTNSEMLWPEAGAEYALPDIVGDPLPPDPETPDLISQTLRIGFKDKTRLDRVVLKNLNLGKESLAKSFEITRNATTGVTGAQAYLFIGDIIITNSSAPTLAWGNMELGSVTLAARVDGHTQEIQQDSTVTQVIIDSDRGSGTYTAQDSKVDRIVLQINGTNGASIGVLEIDNVDASVGSWSWDYVKAGSLSLDGTNEFGNSTGINVASATWADTISARTIVDNLVDVPISVK
jgi:hypothetical protein